MRASTELGIQAAVLLGWNRLAFDKETIALLIIDPYNDFISEGGKLWDRTKGVTRHSEVGTSSKQRAAAGDLRPKQGAGVHIPSRPPDSPIPTTVNECMRELQMLANGGGRPSHVQ